MHGRSIKMDKIVVGSDSCKIQEVVKAMKEDGTSFAQLLQHWQGFAFCLEVSDTDVLALRRRINLESLQLNEVPREILNIWLANRGKGATLQKLFDALVSVGNTALAEAVKKRFCSQD